jgi:HlyD family secretion protein
MKKRLIVAGAVLMLCACGNKEKEYDATGTFEATEVTVSAKATGELKTFNISEGQAVEQGAVVGSIDAYQLQQTSEQLEAQKRQLGATRSATDSRRLDLEKQLSSISQQIANAQRERQRFAELVADGAVPKKQLDDINYQIKVLERQREATRDQIRSNNASLAEQSKGIGAQIDGLNAQQRQIADQIANAQVKAPIAGTVLEKYVEQGEFVAIGKPLFKMADVQNLYLRAYVTSSQLKDLKIGQKVKVFADYGDKEKKTYEGTVAWISSRS